MTQKLRRIILLHFGLITFRFHFGKIRQVIIFIMFVFGRVHDSQNQSRILNCGPTKSLQMMQDEIPNLFKAYYTWESQNLGNRKFWSFGKRRGPGNPEDPSNKLLKTLNMGAISLRKHGMAIWQYGINVFKKAWIGTLEYGINIFKKTWDGNLVTAHADKGT